MTSAASFDRSAAVSLEILIRKAASLRRFADSVQAAGLADPFANKGPYTVFAPTDAAFEKLPAGTLEALLRDSAKLKAILHYHMVSSFIALRDIKSGVIVTLQGSALNAVVSTGEVRINGARITESDLVAANGVVHAIDELLLPPKWRLPRT